MTLNYAHRGLECSGPARARGPGGPGSGRAGLGPENLVLTVGPGRAGPQLPRARAGPGLKFSDMASGRAGPGLVRLLFMHKYLFYMGVTFDPCQDNVLYHET